MADQREKAQGKKNQEENDEGSGYGKSGGHMGAGKSGKEDMGSEKPSDDARMGSEKTDAGGEETQTRSHEDTDSPRGGGSNQDRDKGGVETDVTGGRRAKHNDDEDKYRGRGGGARGKGS